MKEKYFIVLAFSFFAISILKAESVSLQMALDKNWVSFELESTGGVSGLNTSAHIGKCISYTLKNNSGRPLQLYLKPGSLFKSVESSIQSMLFTDTSSWELKAQAIRTGYLNAMCAQMYKKTPPGNRKFVLVGMATVLMQKFARFVSLKQYQTEEAQGLLWTITDNNNMFGKLNEPNQMNQDLLDFAKKEMNLDLYKKNENQILPNTIIPVPDPEKKDVVEIAVADSVEEVASTMNLSESFYLSDSGELSYQILDENLKITKREVINRNQAKGRVSYTLRASSAELGMGKFTVIYFINHKEIYRSIFELVPTE